MARGTPPDRHSVTLGPTSYCSHCYSNQVGLKTPLHGYNLFSASEYLAELLATRAHATQNCGVLMLMGPSLISGG